MENKNSPSYYLDLLYEYMKGKCDISSHTGIAIYFCINENCSLKYICSECIIDNHEHLANHNKFFLPLDNRVKFLKFINLLQIEAKSLPTPGNDTKKENLFQTEIKPKLKENLESFYINLKDYIVSIIDEHMKNRMDEYISKIDEQYKEELTSKGNDGKITFENLLSKVNLEIESFINSKNKNKFSGFHEKLGQIIKLEEENLKKSEEKYNTLPDFKIQKELIKIKINEIIEENISLSINPKNIVSSDEITNIDNENQGKTEKSKIFTFASYSQSEENSNSNSANITNSDLNNSTSNKANLNNFVNSLEFDNTTNEEAQNRNVSIKNRLEDLKNRLSQIKK